MGLLDDAIREHLELKRRRGADPVEIHREEQEALGPVRRAPARAEEEEFGPEVAPDQVGEYEYDDEYEYADDEDEEGKPPYAEDSERARHQAPEEPAHHTFDEHLPAGEPDEESAAAAEPAPPAAGTPPPHAEPDPMTEQLPATYPAEPEPAAAQTPPPRSAEPGGSRPNQETAEYESEHEPEGEDMLEEAPEFLQDTREHDRRRFEQRPPRDFDFED